MKKTNIFQMYKEGITSRQHIPEIYREKMGGKTEQEVYKPSKTKPCDLNALKQPQPKDCK